jgi:hypothetical protein
MDSKKADIKQLAESAVDVISEEMGLCFEEWYRQKLIDMISDKFNELCN